jgi:hypothetical protein
MSTAPPATSARDRVARCSGPRRGSMRAARVRRRARRDARSAPPPLAPGRAESNRVVSALRSAAHTRRTLSRRASDSRSTPLFPISTRLAGRVALEKQDADPPAQLSRRQAQGHCAMGVANAPLRRTTPEVASARAERRRRISAGLAGGRIEDQGFFAGGDRRDGEVAAAEHPLVRAPGVGTRAGHGEVRVGRPRERPRRRASTRAHALVRLLRLVAQTAQSRARLVARSLLFGTPAATRLPSSFTVRTGWDGPAHGRRGGAPDE